MAANRRQGRSLPRDENGEVCELFLAWLPRFEEAARIESEPYTEAACRRTACPMRLNQNRSASDNHG